MPHANLREDVRRNARLIQQARRSYRSSHVPEKLFEQLLYRTRSRRCRRSSAARHAARDLLERARTPHFTYIAPSLEVPKTSTLSKQPFLPNSEKQACRTTVPAILLFSSKLDYEGLVDPGGTVHSACLYHRITTFTAGLYRLSTDCSMFGDVCRFVLPFSTGGKGYARKSGGAIYGQDSFEHLCSWGSIPSGQNVLRNSLV